LLPVGQSGRVCDGRVNGVYATAPCSNVFDHCYNGILSVKNCPRGLVFNPESNQCDYDSNVVGCEAREEVSCTGRKDGTYTIGCSSTFFFCSNGNLHLSTCQHGLFYDVVRNTVSLLVLYQERAWENLLELSSNLGLEDSGSFGLEVFSATTNGESEHVVDIQRFKENQ
ncbi:chitin binding Peritrophin-A domain protein, partial [Ancylostoma caninum]